MELIYLKYLQVVHICLYAVISPYVTAVLSHLYLININFIHIYLYKTHVLGFFTG